MCEPVTVIGILGENLNCPSNAQLALPNVIRGLVYTDPQDSTEISYAVLGEKEMDLAIQNYYLLADGRDISVYTSKKDPTIRVVDPQNIPEFVYTARIMGPNTEKNPLLDLPFYCTTCHDDGSLMPCKKVGHS